MTCYLSIRASHHETLGTAFPVNAVPLAASLWAATICDDALSAVLAPALRDGHQTDQIIKITLIVRKDYDIGDDMLGAAARKGERQARPQAPDVDCSSSLQHELLMIKLNHTSESEPRSRRRALFLSDLCSSLQSRQPL
jgi:hypothetical protein